MPQGDPRPGEKYLHYKNKLYQIITLAQDSQTGERLVVYQALYGTFQVYARPLSMFVSAVDKEKYPQVKQKYCFQWVEFKKSGQESSKLEISKTNLPQPDSAKEETKAEVPGTEEAKEEAKADIAGTEAAPKRVPISRLSAEEKMIAFFDADTMEEKYRILVAMREEITDRMINNMAVALDVVIEEGPLDLRYEELKACLRTMQRYECNRLR